MIDFKLKRGPRGGLTFCFSHHENYGHPDMIAVAENAYFLVELCIVAEKPDYLPHGHWGVTKLSPHDTERIVARLRKLRGAVASATRPKAIIFPAGHAGLTNDLPRVNKARWAAGYRTDIFRQKRETLRFIAEISALLSNWSRGGKDIFVHGI